MYALLVLLGPKYHSISLYEQPFLSYRPNHIKCYKVKDTPNMSYVYVPESQI